MEKRDMSLGGDVSEGPVRVPVGNLSEALKQIREKRAERETSGEESPQPDPDYWDQTM